MASVQATFRGGQYVRASLKNVDSSTLKGGTFAEQGTDGIQAISSNGNTVAAYVINDIPAGEKGDCYIPIAAIFEVQLDSGEDPSFVDDVEIRTDGNWQETTAGTASGWVVNKDPSSGGKADVVVVSDIVK